MSDPRDTRPEQTDVVQVGSKSDGRLLAGTLIVVSLIVLAVIKPWAAATTPGSAAGAAVPSSPTDSIGRTVPIPTEPTGLPDPNHTQCFTPTGFRLFATEQNFGRPTRTWVSLDPVQASGPTDPQVVFVRLVTEGIDALGYCAPVGPAAWPGVTAVAAWRIDGAGVASPLALQRLTSDAPSDLDVGGIFRPAEAAAQNPANGARPSAAIGGSWPPGRYVFELAFVTAHTGRWFGVEIVAFAPPSVRPAPSPNSTSPPIRATSAIPH